MTHFAELSDAERERITAAVAGAEQRSAGEIVTILTRRSDGYTDIALIWAAIAAFLALLLLAYAPDFWLGLIDRITGAWANERSPRELFALAGIAAMVMFVGMLVLQLWRPLKFALVPGPIRSARVRGRAVAAFKIGAERRTHGRTGILIYLSLDERRAEIVADEAIAGQVSPEVWGDAMAAMLAEIRQGRVADGLIAAIERVGVVLAEYVPRADNDVNELPDRLIEV